MFIDGKIVQEASNKAEIIALNPFTEEKIGSVANASKDDVAEAVASASKALKGWKEMGGVKRSQFLRAIAEEFMARKDSLAVLETKNCGKPLPESEWDIDDCSACFTYYADLAKKLEEEMQNKPVDVGDENFKCLLRYEPIGVAGAIIPFNYPLLMLCWKVAPALAAGATVILKPSEYTPLTAIEFAKMCQKVNLPPGVVNILTGDGSVGEMIVNHPKVSAVAFTGSVATGIRVAQAAAPLVKQVTAELGGKSAAIVFKDCPDMNMVAEWVCFGCFWTNGQICTATSRLLVHEDIADQFIDKLKIIGQNIKMGDPMQQDCRLGPLISQKQQEKALAFVQHGLRQGAKLLLGTGTKPTSKGFFVEPTILKIDSTDNVCWTEEIFGPVLTVKTFRTDEEAVALANDSKFGLAAAVFSKDTERLTNVANQLEVGIVWQNCSQPCFCQLPWGGQKNSGFGRDLGEFGLMKFLEPKQIVQYMSKDPLGWYDCAKL